MKKYHGDKSKMSKGHANMPSELVMKEYPKGSYGSASDYNDSREGIDALAKSNHMNMMKGPGKRS